MGRDVIGWTTEKKCLGPWDNVQCKHLNRSLSPGDLWPELGKVLWHAHKGDYILPRHMKFLASKGIGTGAKHLLTNPDALKKGLIENWAKNVANQITATSVPLDDDESWKLTAFCNASAYWTSTTNSDLRRLEAIAEAGAVFKTLHPGPCPFCGAPPEAQVHERSCDVDPDQISAAARAEIERINVLRAGLVETKQRLFTEGQQLSERTDRAADEQRQVSRRAQQIANILRERRRGIGDLDHEAQQLRFQLKDADVLEELKTELARMNETIAAGEDQIGSKPGATLPPAETTEFAADIETILQAWDFPEVGRVAWEESRMDVTIGARRRGDQGKGLRAITCSAFLLGLLKRCLAKTRPHLGLLVLDSPLLAYWKPEGQADDLRGTRVDECFYRWMATLPESNQVLVMENRPLPDWVSDSAHIIHFTKNRATGRYGLFEVERT